VAISTAEDAFYILRFDRDAYDAKGEGGAEITDEGVREAFEVCAEALTTNYRTHHQDGHRIVDCFNYTTSNRLCYFVGSEFYISAFDPKPSLSFILHLLL
jgi:coatomer subunit beta'